jgi:anti-sigma B factor antagonist/stage II sporulation protein AA (anti-sigma F factor antagonist)
MELAESRTGVVVTLAPTGRIDHQTADKLQEALQPYLAKCSADGDRLLIDLSNVNYISSVGLRALLLAAKAARANKGRIAVAGMQPTVAEVLRISRTDSILPTYAGIADAIAELERPSP